MMGILAGPNLTQATDLIHLIITNHKSDFWDAKFKMEMRFFLSKCGSFYKGT